MLESFAFLTSISIAFLGHEFAERKITKNGEKQVKLIVKGRQIHHSFFGIVFIIFGITALSGMWTVVFLGYGVGNIWHHKFTHNRVGENGLIFISRMIK